MDIAIEAKGLTKQFNGDVAVDNLSLKVRPGEIYGFVGLNGAGKTTTIRMLLGLIRPTRGSAYLLGQPVHAGRSDIWSRVGYMVETPHAYPELTVRENLEVVRRLRLVSDPRAADRIIERLGLRPHRDKPAGVLSQGNRRRLGLAKALNHRPSVLLLGESSLAYDQGRLDEAIVLVSEPSRLSIVTASSLLLNITYVRTTRVSGVVHNGVATDFGGSSR